MRATAILLVIVGHSFLGYYPGPFPFSEHVRRMGFPVLDAHRFAGARTFNAFDDIYLMALIFFLSGLFAWGSLKRKGEAAYVRDRLVRLGPTFLFAAIVVGGVAYYAPYLQAHPASANLADYFATWETPAHWMSGAAWFIAALLAYDLIAAGALTRAPRLMQGLVALTRGSDRTLRFWGVAVAASALAYLPMVVVFGQYEWFNLGPFWLQKSRGLLYGVWFLLGVGVGASGLDKSLAAPGSALARRWWAWLAAAIVVFLIVGNLQLLSLKKHVWDELGWRALIGAGWVVSCATSALAILALFARFAKPSRILDNLSANAFGIYLVHYAFVTWSQYALLTSPLPPIGKAAIVIVVVTAASWTLTAALRRIPAVARIV